MSLHGTLETFALPDVLALLAATKKSGELRVVGGSVDGRVWFAAGQVVAADVGSSTAFVDAVFDLLRLHTGKFSFDADREAPAPGEPVAIDTIVGEAQTRLDEWRAIEAVVPSLAHAVNLVADIRDPHVMVTGEQWRALVAVASAPTVQSVMERLGLGEFGTCKALKSLVEAGLVAIGAPPAAVEPAAEPATIVVTTEPDASLPAPSAAEDLSPAVVEPVETPTSEEAPASVEAPAPVEAASAPADEPAPPAAPAATAPAPVKEATKTGKAKIAPMTTSPAASAEVLEAEATPAPKPAKPKSLKGPEVAADADPVVVAKKESAVTPAPTEQPAPVVVEETAPAAAEAPAPVADEAQAEGDEPINRGLLLKFLSSVRT